MYPKNFTELIALITVLTPLIIGTFAGLRSARTRAQEIDLVRWRRLNELTDVLYNSDHKHGLLAQLAAETEIGETTGRQRRAALAVIASARIQFASTTELSAILAIALARCSRSWWKRQLGFY